MQFGRKSEKLARQIEQLELRLPSAMERSSRIWWKVSDRPDACGEAQTAETTESVFVTADLDFKPAARDVKIEFLLEKYVATILRPAVMLISQQPMQFTWGSGGSFYRVLFKGHRGVGYEWLGPETNAQYTSESQIEKCHTGTQPELVADAADDYWHNCAAHDSRA